ncbi:hypothetical protein JCM3775_004183 [Rhodotorula graminis]
MLPVRRDRPPSSALPRPVPLPTSSSVNTRPLAPPATPGRSLCDLSRFDLDALLDSPTSDNHGALIDQAEPSWLADQSAFTLGARTPARARATVLVDDESMLQDGTFAQGGDSDGEATQDDLVETVDNQLELQVPQADVASSTTAEPAPANSRPPSSPTSFAAPLTVESSPARDLSAPSSAAFTEPSAASSVGTLPPAVAPVPPSPPAACPLRLDPPPPAVDAVGTARARSSSRTPALSAATPPPVDRRATLDRLSAAAARPLVVDARAVSAPTEDVAGLRRDVSDVVDEPKTVSPSRSPKNERAQQPSPAPAAVALGAKTAPVNEDEAASSAPQVVDGPPRPPTRGIPPPLVQPAPVARQPLAIASRPPRLLASSSSLPPPAEPVKKRLTAEKGVPDVDEEARRRVREAKAERERAARERKERLGREAAAKKAGQRRPRGVAQDEVDGVEAARAGQGTSTTASAHEPVPAPVPAPAPACEPEPASARSSLARTELVGGDVYDDSPLPILAFDADSSLPSMGAPLDFAGPEHQRGRLALGLGVDAAQAQGVTSTPARPAARKAGRELVAEKADGQTAPQREPQVSRASIASTPAPLGEEPVAPAPTEVKLEEQNEGDELGSASGAQVKRRRRASRLTLSKAGPSDLVASMSSAHRRVARPSMGKAVRVVLLAPGPADPAASTAAGPALLAASASSSSGTLSRSQRRASRVPADSAPAANVVPPARASTATFDASSSSRRPGRSSLAPAPPTPPTRPAKATRIAESTRIEETVSLSASGTLKTSARRASRLFPVAEEQVAVQETAHGATTSPLRAPVSSAPLKPSHTASTSRPRSASTSQPHVLNATVAHQHVYVEPPRVPPPPGKVIGGVTLPSSFSFADAESELAAVREAERVRRVEEKERRERHVEEVVEERKRKRDEVGGWAVASSGAAKEGQEHKRQRLVDPLARSTSSAAPPVRSAPPHLASSSPARVVPHLGLAPTIERSHLRSSSPAAQHAAVPAAPAHEPVSAPEPVALTREALERNTRCAGPRVDLDRRVSLWASEGRLEDVEEEVEDVQEAAVTAVAAEAVAQQVQARREQGMVLEQQQEHVEEQGQIEQPFPTNVAPGLSTSSNVVDAVAAAAAERAPEPAAASTSTATASYAQARAPGPSSSSAAAVACVSRRVPPQGPAPAAPAAPRRAQASATAPASPLFTAQLGAWQARERSTLGGARGVHGPARVPAPASAAAPPHAAGTRVRRALEAVAPARPGPVKRARIVSGPAPAPVTKGAPPVAGPRRAPVAVQRAKENAPAGGSSAGAGAAAAPKTGVAAELEQLRQARAEWSERQKRREEEVRRRREDERKREAEQERDKLAQLRASLARGGPQPGAKGGARRAERV